MKTIGPLDIPCPNGKCGAQAGERCRSLINPSQAFPIRNSVGPHHSRRLMAKRANKERMADEHAE